MLRAIAPGAVSAYAVPGLTYGVLATSGGAPTAAGTGYVPSDSIALTGGTATTSAVLAVTDTQVVSATVNAGGSGGTNGTQTVTGTTGTGTKFQASVTVAGNAITAVLSITLAGDYTVNPTDITQEPVTGASLVGAKLSVVMGVLKFQVTNPGVYTAIPGSPATMAQGSTSGTGTGATFPISFGPLAASIVGATFTAGNGNLFLGGEQPQSTLAGAENVFLGDRAGGKFVGSSQFNVCVGHNAGGIGGASTFTASSVTCIGTDAGRNIQTGCDSAVIIGAAAGQNVAGSQNTVIGKNAATVLSSGTQNTFIGTSAGATPTTSSGNVVIGYNADINTATGHHNSVIIGSNNNGGGRGAKGNGQSVVIGAQAGNNSLTGQNNTILGYQVASTTLTTGTNNVLIGTTANIDTAAAATSNTIGIGAGSTAVISATGCGTPSTSVITTAGNLAVGAYESTSVGNALTAAGTTQGTALALTKQINNVTTAAASTGVALPAASTVGIGGYVIVFNAGANLIKVYGINSGSDTIDGVAGATGVSLTAAKRCVYYVTAASTWVSAQLGVVSA